MISADLPAARIAEGEIASAPFAAWRAACVSGAPTLPSTTGTAGLLQMYASAAESVSFQSARVDTDIGELNVQADWNDAGGRRQCRSRRFVGHAGRFDQRWVGGVGADNIAADERLAAAEVEPRAGYKRFVRLSAVDLHVRADVAGAVRGRQERYVKRAGFRCFDNAAGFILHGETAAGCKRNVDPAAAYVHWIAIVEQRYVQYIARVALNNLERAKRKRSHHVERDGIVLCLHAFLPVTNGFIRGIHWYYPAGKESEFR